MRPGDTVPDFAFLRPDGSRGQLSEFCTADFLLLVFLRHLACAACNAHLGEVDAARERFAARGCPVLVVSQAKPKILTLYTSRKVWGVPLVGDPDRAVYTVFGLERAGRLAFFKPLVLWRFFRAMTKGYLAARPYAGEDQRQLGGDFIITRERKLVFAYRSIDPTDRPSVAALLATLPASPTAGERTPATANG
ncbi:SelL-related redox protein [Frigoriglobus tundricola]|uniref:Thioredoxin domain-containing protein n=1 Tax=Frigoriglobus tundricola TaxID=2774151 RepID=A0A6M5YJU4_9BACT|nr:SelL-related redox protein [Frigoriglobus tundricola]QJW94248.1 hypothetical protein FTUN_1768 [Frigoriglobus tundricola]